MSTSVSIKDAETFIAAYRNPVSQVTGHFLPLKVEDKGDKNGVLDPGELLEKKEDQWVPADQKRYDNLSQKIPFLKSRNCWRLFEDPIKAKDFGRILTRTGYSVAVVEQPETKNGFVDEGEIHIYTDPSPGGPSKVPHVTVFEPVSREQHEELMKLGRAFTIYEALQDEAMKDLSSEMPGCAH